MQVLVQACIVQTVAAGVHVQTHAPVKHRGASAADLMCMCAGVLVPPLLLAHGVLHQVAGRHIDLQRE